jgi:hypothetical protein
VQKQRRIVGGRLSLASGGLLSRLAILWLSVRPLVSECSRVWRAPSLPAGRRWQLLLMVLLLRLYVGYEWLRLQWPGQEPLR